MKTPNLKLLIPNLKLFVVFLFLVAISCIFLLNKHSSMLYVKNILEWDSLNLALWLGSACCFIVHYLSIKNDDLYSGGLIFKHFGKFADSAFAIVTYGLASTTSSAILKGVYIQEFFKTKVYFTHFDQIDIWSMLIVCVFLLGYSIFASITALKSAIFNSQTEVAVPIKR